MKKTMSFVSLTLIILLLCSCAGNTQHPFSENFRAGIVSTEEKAEDFDLSPEPKRSYIASYNSDVYHIADCVYVNRIKPYNMRHFYSVNEAEDHGYRKCCICLQ